MLFVYVLVSCLERAWFDAERDKAHGEIDSSGALIEGADAKAQLNKCRIVLQLRDYGCDECLRDTTFAMRCGYIDPADVSFVAFLCLWFAIESRDPY